MHRLLLHVCCAPCATHPHRVLEAAGWSPVLFFCNPNLAPREEHDLRLAEAQRYAREAGLEFLAPPPEFEAWEEAVRGLEDRPEGGERCGICYAFRLRRTARAAREAGCEAFATTLSVSPAKKAALIDLAGSAAAREHGVTYVPADFKKKGGFLESVRLSKEHGLYRQDYCGCRFSLEERRKRSGDRK
jgi:epoxyqueuosine reductase